MWQEEEESVVDGPIAHVEVVIGVIGLDFFDTIYNLSFVKAFISAFKDESEIFLSKLEYSV